MTLMVDYILAYKREPIICRIYGDCLVNMYQFKALHTEKSCSQELRMDRHALLHCSKVGEGHKRKCCIHIFSVFKHTYTDFVCLFNDRKHSGCLFPVEAIFSSKLYTVIIKVQDDSRL